MYEPDEDYQTRWIKAEYEVMGWWPKIEGWGWKDDCEDREEIIKPGLPSV